MQGLHHRSGARPHAAHRASVCQSRTSVKPFCRRGAFPVSWSPLAGLDGFQTQLGSRMPDSRQRFVPAQATGSASVLDNQPAEQEEQSYADQHDELRQVHGPQSVWPGGNLTAVVLGGGETDGRRLFPLTAHRTLPALPFGGAYRIIDILMSNLINSGINKIHILTAYNSYSLNRHLQRTYDMSGGVPFGGDGYIEVVANSLSPDSAQWQTGTADCVRRFMTYFESNTKNRFIEDVLVLPGDHIYAADLDPVINYHHSTGADLTIVCRPVSGEQASRLGIVKLDPSSRIRAFAEKPGPDELPNLAMSDNEMAPFMSTANAATAAQAEAAAKRAATNGGARVGNGNGGRMVLDTVTSMDEVELTPGSDAYVGSTGIYIFKRKVLVDVLQRHQKAHDFGRQLIPEIIREGFRVFAYRLPGYWADVGGCVGDFYAANLALLGDHPSINFETPSSSPFFRYPLTIPASQVSGTRLNRALVSAGCIIRDSTIINSVVGPRSIIGPNVTMADSVFMGADHYGHERPEQRPESPAYPPLGVGEGSVLKRTVVDLNARIGKGVRLVNSEGVYESYDRAVQGLYIRDGIVVVARNAVVPDGTVL